MRRSGKESPTKSAEEQHSRLKNYLRAREVLLHRGLIFPQPQGSPRKSKSLLGLSLLGAPVYPPCNEEVGSQVRGRVLKLVVSSRARVPWISQEFIKADAPKAGVPRLRGSWWGLGIPPTPTTTVEILAPVARIDYSAGE
jgi:hypothetical protein